MAQIYNIISIVGFVLALLGLIAVVVLWFVFKIPNVINDLTGKTTQRSLEQMQREAKSGKGRNAKGYMPAFNSGPDSSELSQKMKDIKAANKAGENTAKIAGGINLDGEIIPATDVLEEEITETEVLGTAKLDEEVPGTEVLGTAKLDEEVPGTEVLGTAKLDEEVSETELLSSNETAEEFEIIQDIVIINTKEIIR